MVEGVAVDSCLPCLPDKSWETIFKFLINDDYNDDYSNDNNNYLFRSQSAVSKQFLSITNHLLFSLNVNINDKPSVTVTVTNHPVFSVNVNIIAKRSDFLSRLIHRFSNLNSLHLIGNKLDKSLSQISHLPFISLKSLNLNCVMCHFPNNFPSDGLRLVSQNITTLTSLTCSNIPSVHSTHLFLIAEFFPLLEQFNLNLDSSQMLLHSREKLLHRQSSLIEGVKALSSSLLKLRKVDLTNHYYITNQCLCYLFNKRKLLEEAIIIGCNEITNNGIASALCKRPTVKAVSTRHL